MGESVIQLRLTPPVPPQPRPFIPDQLNTLTDIRSRSASNGAALSLLQRQLKSIQDLAKKVEKRIAEYKIEAHWLQRHSFDLGACSVHHLPIEVLGVIFDFCRTDPSSINRRRGELTPDPAPWLLSSVCKTWRHIVQATPRLWSTIPGPIPLHAQYVQKWQRNLLRASMERSSPATIRANLIISEEFLSRAMINRQSMYNLLVPHLSKIEHLALTREDPFSQAYVHIPLVELSSLRSLSLYGWDFPTPVPFPEKAEGFGVFLYKMPLLERATIHHPLGLGGDRDITILGFPWQQLTSITFQDVDLTIVRKVLACAEQLVELRVLEIQALSPYIPLGVNRQTITHDKLRLLHLRYPRQFVGMGMPVDHVLFFDTMNLPNLENLSLIHNDPFPTAMITNLLKRSRCSLSDLEISSTEHLESLLQTCPDLKTLRLDLPVRDYDLKMFTCTTQKGWLVPQLEHLTLLSPRITDDDSLAALIQARMQAGDVRDLQRIDLAIISTKPDDHQDDQYDDLFEQTDDLFEFPDNCINTVMYILQAECGYEVVNNYSRFSEHLAKLCHLLDESVIVVMESERYDDADVALGSEGTCILRYLLKIYHYLDEIEELEALYPTIFTLKKRLRKALQVFTHDPWFLDTPPAGWIRTPIVGYGVGRLTYTAPTAPFNLRGNIPFSRHLE